MTTQSASAAPGSPEATAGSSGPAVADEPRPVEASRAVASRSRPGRHSTTVSARRPALPGVSVWYPTTANRSAIGLAWLLFPVALRTRTATWAGGRGPAGAVLVVVVASGGATRRPAGGRRPSAGGAGRAAPHSS